MEDSPNFYISEFGKDEDLDKQQMEEEDDDDDDEEEEIEDNESEETQCSLSLMSIKVDDLVNSNTTCQRPEANFSGNLKQGLASVPDEPQEDPDQDADEESHDSFHCRHCVRHFSSRQGLERHLHIHALANHQTHTFKCKYCSKFFGSKIGRRRHERRHEDARARPGSLIKPVNSICSSLQTDGENVSCATGSVEGNQKSVSDEHQDLQGGHACKYCKKVFSTHRNMQRHRRRIHERHLRLKGHKVTLPQQTTTLQKASTSQEEFKPICDTNPVTVQENKGERGQQYMLDISSNISENLSFYIDGKIVSTSTVSSCEVVEVNSGSATLVGLDAVILSPAQISQALNAEGATGKEFPGQPLSKRRTATPPLLPQIKTELESESVLSSSPSSSIVSSLIENFLPYNMESIILQKEKTVFLSPKLKQLLQTQDGLKPTLALITDGQNLCSPLSLTVLPAGSGRFKRRTGSPPNTPQESPTLNVENTIPDRGDSVGLKEPYLESNCCSPALDMSGNDENSTNPPIEEPIATHVLLDSWPLSGGNSCNQQPLDLSAVKRNELECPGEAVLDLSLQRKDTDDSEAKGHPVPQLLIKKRKPDTSMLEKVLMNEYANLDLAGAQGLDLRGLPVEPLITDIAIVTASDVSPASEELLFGVALPSATLNPPPSSLTPISIHSASPCTLALASPTSHTALPTAPALFTVLAPSTSSTSGPANQPTFQVLAPEISTEPFVICTDKPFNSAECELSTALPDWATTANSANLVTISQPLDSTLSLPGHMFLADPSIVLNAPVVHSAISSEAPCSPALTLNDSLINSFNITSNTVLIECTIALDDPGNIAPTGITVQEDTGEPLEPAQMVIRHVEQQQMLSLPGHEPVDPTILASSIAESVTFSTTSAAISECAPVGDTNSSPIFDTKEEGPNQKEEMIDEPVCPSEMAPKTSPTSHEATVKISVNNTKPQETFTKNFMCNVCDKLYHSMKELGHHVSEHSDKWPYKCEFCVLLFGNPSALFEHRSVLHGVGNIYVCSLCTKEFAYLCNLKHHQEEVHPGQQCEYTEEENGKLRPQNYNNSTKVSPETLYPSPTIESKNGVMKDDGDLDDATEELFTTIKIMSSDGNKLKDPDVRLGINQHYPSFKPPPFPYHNRSPAATLGVGTATNFTTHNIPQTFSTAIRCTKCGKSFDNMPELHKHILSCANASDKRRYTPKKNPIPLRHFAKGQNGVLASTNATNGQDASRRSSQTNGLKSNQEVPSEQKNHPHNTRKKQMIERAISQKSKSSSLSNKSSIQAGAVYVCPHCSREFTYRRSRTKHVAICPMKAKEVKKRKDGSVSFTKENNGHLRRGLVSSEEKKQATEQKSRPHSSSPAKRPAILPAHAVLANKKCKTISKGSGRPRQETLSRVLHVVKEVPINIAVLNSKKVEHLANQTHKGAAGPEPLTTPEPQDPAV